MNTAAYGRVDGCRGDGCSWCTRLLQLVSYKPRFHSGSIRNTCRSNNFSHCDNYWLWKCDAYSIHVHRVRKKDQNVFFIISSVKIRRFWWNLVFSFLNKLAAKSCKRFPPRGFQWTNYKYRNPYSSLYELLMSRKVAVKFNFTKCQICGPLPGVVRPLHCECDPCKQICGPSYCSSWIFVAMLLNFRRVRYSTI